MRLQKDLATPFFCCWCRHGQAHVEWRPAGVFIIRYDIFRTKAGVAMTTIACPLILYSIRASFGSFPTGFPTDAIFGKLYEFDRNFLVEIIFRRETYVIML